MTTPPLPPDNPPPTTPDPLEAELASLSRWDGPAPAPRPWEEAARQTEGWRLYLHRPLPYVAAAAAVLILAVIFAGALPTLRSHRELKLAKDLAGNPSTDLAMNYRINAPTESQLQNRNLQEWKDSNARNIREPMDNLSQNSPATIDGQDRSGNGGYDRGAGYRNGAGGRTDAERRTSDAETRRAKAPEQSITVQPDPAELEKKSVPLPTVAAPPPPPAAPAAPAEPPRAAPAGPSTPGAGAPAREDAPKTRDAAGSKQEAPSRGMPVPAVEPGKPATPPAPSPAATPVMDKDMGAPVVAQAPIRSVIQHAKQEVLVPDVRAAVAAITALVEPKSSEFIEQQVVTGDDRKPQTLSGTLVLRVTHERITAVRGAVHKLGRITTDTLASDDVTEQIVDLGARLRNERRLEAELLKVIEDRKGDKLEEVMKARESLSGVRQNIERLAAQNENLAKQVALTTLTVTVRHDDVEAAPPAIPTTGDKITQAANQGSATLTNSIAGLVEFVIGGLVWWVLIAVIALAAFIVIRRSNRRARSEPPPSA